MTLLAVHPLALPLTVFGLVLTLWLLGLLVVDSRKQRMRVEVAAPETTGPTWLEESIGASHGFRIEEALSLGASAEKRSDRVLFLGLLVLFTFAWAIFTSMLIGLGIALLVYVFVRRVQSLRRGKRSAEAQKSSLFAMRLGTRVLRAGHTLSGMFRVLAREVPGSVGRSFAEIVHREELGESTEDAIGAVLLKSDITEMRAFGLTLLIQSGAGGDPSIVTDRLTQSMEERARILRKTRTLLAYGRTTATALVILSFLLFFSLSFLQEGYWEFLLNDPVGRSMLAVSVILMGIGLHVVQRYVRSDVVYSRAAS